MEKLKEMLWGTFGIFGGIVFFCLVFFMGIIPFYVVISRFVPSIFAITVLFLIYYWLSSKFVVTFGIIQTLLWIVGLFFIIAYPTWFFISYIVLFVIYAYQYITNLIRGMKRK